MTYSAAAGDTFAAGATFTSYNALMVKSRSLGSTAAQLPASTAWPVANSAYLVPFELPAPATFLEAFWISGTTPGTANIDLGIYGEDFTRITSLGATAAANTTGVLQPAGGAALSPAVTLGRGRYYMAMSAAATSITTQAIVSLARVLRGLGMVQMASAHPLPTTITPAAMTADSFALFGLASVTNLL